ncbi:MAG: SCO family protein, partial [Advenella sp.]
MRVRLSLILALAAPLVFHAALAQGIPDVPGATQSQRPTTIYPIANHLPDLSFSLNASEGKILTEQAVKGKVVMLFFGYASCPDICPTTMAQLSEVMQQLGAKSNEAQILFISVDPHRDTPEVLQAYVNAFNNGAIGLTGSEQQIASVARRYRVAYQISKPKDASNPQAYEVMHGRGIYIFDKD